MNGEGGSVLPTVGYSAMVLEMTVGQGHLRRQVEWLEARGLRALQGLPTRRTTGPQFSQVEGPWNELRGLPDGPVSFGHEPTDIDRRFFPPTAEENVAWVREQVAGGARYVTHRLDEVWSLAHWGAVAELHPDILGRELDRTGLAEVEDRARMLAASQSRGVLLLDTGHVQEHPLLDSTKLVWRQAAAGLYCPIAHFQVTRGTREIMKVMAGQRTRAVELLQVWYLEQRRFGWSANELVVVNEATPLHLGKLALLRYPAALLPQGAARFQLKLARRLREWLERWERQFQAGLPT